MRIGLEFGPGSCHQDFVCSGRPTERRPERAERAIRVWQLVRAMTPRFRRRFDVTGTVPTPRWSDPAPPVMWSCDLVLNSVPRPTCAPCGTTPSATAVEPNPQLRFAQRSAKPGDHPANDPDGPELRAGVAWARHVADCSGSSLPQPEVFVLAGLDSWRTFGAMFEQMICLARQ